MSVILRKRAAPPIRGSAWHGARPRRFFGRLGEASLPPGCRPDLESARHPPHSAPLLCEMPLIDRLERKWGWIAIPGIIRIILFFQVLVFVLLQFQIPHLNAGEIPGLIDQLRLDPRKVLKGEVWRLVTFVFLPQTLTSEIAMLFIVVFTFFLSTLIERMWGSFRVTVYVLGGMIGMIVGSFVFPGNSEVPFLYGGGFGWWLLFGGPGRFLLFSSILFACAVYQPHYTIMLFGIIPIRMMWLAIFDGGMILIDILRAPSIPPPIGGTLLSLAIILGISNFLIVFGPGFRRALKMKAETAVRRREYQSQLGPEDESLHRCATCGSTEHDDPDLHFRVAADGEEYCTSCRPLKKKADK